MEQDHFAFHGYLIHQNAAVLLKTIIILENNNTHFLVC